MYAPLCTIIGSVVGGFVEACIALVCCLRARKKQDKSLFDEEPKWGYTAEENPDNDSKLA
jgi:hypothetical protein